MTFLALALCILSQTPDLLDQANRLMQQERYESAIEIYQKILQEKPESYPAKFGLGRALAYSGQWEKAENIFTEILKNDPKNVDALLQRGLVRSWQEKYEVAEQDLRRVISEAPNYAGAYMALANIYKWTSRYEAALEIYDQYIQLNPDDPAPHIESAKIYRMISQPNKFEDELKAAKQKGAKETVLEEIRQAEGFVEEGYWELRLGYNYHSLSDGLSDWHEYSTRLIREFPHGSVALEWMQYHHFSDRDDALQIDTYFDLWQDAYGNFRFQAARDTDFLANTDYRLELYQGFAESWEVSANARVMKFDNNSVDIYGVSLGRYLGDFYLRGNIYISPEFDEELLSYAIMGRYYFSPDSFIEMSGGYGEELITVAAGPVLENRDTVSIGLKYQRYFNAKIGFSLGYEFFDIEDIWNRSGVTTSLMYRW